MKRRDWRKIKRLIKNLSPQAGQDVVNDLTQVADTVAEMSWLWTIHARKIALREGINPLAGILANQVITALADANTHDGRGGETINNMSLRAHLFEIIHMIQTRKVRSKRK